MLALMIGALAMATAFAAAAPAVDIVGDWSGALDTGGGSLHLVVHISADRDGHLSATMDSPDQSTTGIEVTTISFNKPDLHFEIREIGGVFDGKANGDVTEVAGTWKQGSVSLTLTLVRAGK